MIDAVQNLVRGTDALVARAYLAAFRERDALRTFLFHSLFRDEAEIGLNLVDPLQRTTVAQFRKFVVYYLSHGYRFVTPSDLLAGIGPGGKYAMITFDDGYYNNTLALPVLEEFRVPAVFFVTTDNVAGNKGFWWDVLHRELSARKAPARSIYREGVALKSKRTDEIEGELIARFGPRAFEPRGDIDRPFNPGELRAFAAHPYVHLGNHTAGHAILTNYTREQVRDQVVGAQEAIRAMAGVSPTVIAYPNGAHSAAILQTCGEVGLKVGFTTRPEKTPLPLGAHSPSLLRLGRFVPHGDSPIETQCRTYRSDLLLYGKFRDGYLRLARGRNEDCEAVAGVRRNKTFPKRAKAPTPFYLLGGMRPGNGRTGPRGLGVGRSSTARPGVRDVREILDRLFQSLPGGRGRGHDEPERLAREVVRLHEEGRYRQAEDAARRCVEVQRGRLGERHPDYATALMNLALLLQTQGDLDAAEPLLRQALDVRKEALGERDPQYAASLSQLAELLQLRGDLDAAEPLLRQSLDVRREALGEQHPDYATGLTGLAFLLHRRGENSDAEPLLRQALDVRRAALGDRHPMVATALGNVGLILQGQGDVAGAEPLFRQALEIRREAQGEQHPDYAAGLSHLGTLLFERYDHAAAEPLLRQAVAIRKNALGPGHPDVAADLKTLDAILQARSRQTAPVNGTLGHARPALPIPTEARDSALEDLGRGPREIASEARVLACTFARLGAAMADAAQGLQDGFPPPTSLLNDSAGCHNAFTALHDEAIRRAGGSEFAPPAGASLSVNELAELMDRVAEAEDESARRVDCQRQALGVLDRVLTLRHVIPSEASLLQPCHEAASALRPSLAGSNLSDSLPSDAAPLAGGLHPLSALLRLIDSDSSLDDDDWTRLHEEVAAAFGRPLAAAAVRGRLQTSA